MNNQDINNYDAYLQKAYEEQTDAYSNKRQQKPKQGKRECRIKSRGNGAQNDKDSILVEAKGKNHELHEFS